VDGLWATKSEGVGLIDRAISFQDFQPMLSRYLNVTDGRTDRQTDESNLITALCTSASRGKSTQYVESNDIREQKARRDRQNATIFINGLPLLAPASPNKRRRRRRQR